MLIANPTTARSALRSIRSNPPLTNISLKRRSLIRLALRSASTTTQPSQAGHPPPPPRATPSSPRPETPALEPQSTSRPSIPTESDPSGTIPPTTSPSGPSIASSAFAAAPSEQALTWNTYLNLRRIRRRYNLAASLSCAVGTTAGGAIALTNTMERAGLDAFSVFGLDPFLVSGMTMLGCGAVGWLLGVRHRWAHRWDRQRAIFRIHQPTEHQIRSSQKR